MFVRWDGGPPRGRVGEEVEEVGSGEALSNNRLPDMVGNGSYGGICDFKCDYIGRVIEVG